MLHRYFSGRNTLISIFALSFTALGLAQQPAAPRTPGGHPSLEGIWNNSSLTPLQRPVALGDKAFYTPEEAAALAKKLLQQGDRDRRPSSRDSDVAGAYNEAWFDRGTSFDERRTSLIIDPPDGRIPPITPQAQQRLKAIQARFAQHPADGPEDRPMHERCLLFGQAGPPMIPSGYNNNYQIVQTPDSIAILAEMGELVRVIPLDGRPHLPQNVHQWTGDSRGHWEGSTLVVETTNVRVDDHSRFEPSYDGMIDANYHVTERFTRTGPDSILYRATVDDPTVYTKPWTVEVSMTKVETPLLEYACHEGNYAMVDILSGERALEKKAAEHTGQ